MSFSGLRVLSFESRRAAEMAELIRRQEGEPTVAPGMREVALKENTQAYAFAERLFAGQFDMVILLTGVGTRLLDRVITARYGVERLADGLRRVAVVARGPKPMAALREMNVPAAAVAPEPNTWREVLAVTEGRPERRIAVQEYGRSNRELLAALRARGAEVTPVPVYQWDLPEDARPLREAVRRFANGEFEVVLFTTGVQVDHLFRVAAGEKILDEARRAFARVLTASIGPTTTEALESWELRVDFEPSHPKMGLLVNETAAHAAELLARKRGAMKAR